MQNELDHLPCHRRRILVVRHLAGLVGSAKDWAWVMTLCWAARDVSNHSPINTADSVACSAFLVSVAHDELPQLALPQSLLRLAMRKLQLSEETHISA
jgi:hypothetical protein